MSLHGAQPTLAWYLADDETSRLIAALPWASTSLGAIESWPPCLHSSLSLCLTSDFPVMLWLGPDQLLVYNSAARPIMGEKHPSCLGQPCKEVFPEAWAWMKPPLDTVMCTGKGTVSSDWFCPLLRHGYLEESYWSCAHTPLIAPNRRVLGVLSTLHSCTERIIGERRLITLRNLSLSMSSATSEAEACRLGAEVLTQNQLDVAAALLYLPRTDRRALLLVQSVRFPAAAELIIRAPECELSRNVAAVSASGECCVVSLPAELRELLPDAVCNGCSLGKPRAALLLPLEPTGTAHDAHPYGVLFVALHPGCMVNESYKTFLSLVASRLVAALRVASERATEKQRTAELTALDRTKSHFLNSVSGEFRTPLTLILGPIEELLLRCNDDRPLPLAAFRDNFALMQRNGARLLKLVNSLLDFSRIEAGRLQGRYQPVNLDTVTTGLASFFRAECESAGVTLVVRCTPPREPVYIDIEMWEKIVVNLISNAIKFTKRGTIEVRLDEAPDAAGIELSVRDTGCGISAAELPHVFERFRRSRGRAEEGGGIGLALIYELAHLHGGSVRVESEEGCGSTFTVALPYGSGHLPSDQLLACDERSASALARTTRHSDGAITGIDRLAHGTPQQCSATASPSDSECDSPLSASSAPQSASSTRRSSMETGDRAAASRGRVMVVDRNTDMQYYLRRLLCSHHYAVMEARDGEEALAMLRSLPEDELPELVLSDVIMPRLDGIGLLQAVRSEERQVLRHIPILLLSAGASEEASTDGIVAGAEDYLVRPFSTKELLARISGRLEVSRVRRAAAKNEHRLREEAERANAAKDRFLAVLSHELRTPLTPTLLLAETMAADEALSESVREDAHFIARNVRLEAELINDLLDVTKIREHKLELNRQRISVHSVLSQALQLLQGSVQEKAIRVTEHRKAERDVVVGDPARLQQVFWNILGNSVKFTPREGCITVTSDSAGDGLIAVSITDTGKGIAAGVLPRLFNAFEQGGSSITRSFGGLGLGLCITKALAVMHGGSLEVRSEGEGKGATVVVTLPLEPVDPSTDATHPITGASTEPSCSVARAARVQRAANILVVEDNEATITILERLLRRLGHRWQTARCVKDALELCEPVPGSPGFDALLCDVGLPDGTGLDVVREMSRCQPECYCVTLSGYGTAADVQSSMEAGAAQHLTKPVRFAELAEALRRCTAPM